MKNKFVSNNWLNVWGKRKVQSDVIDSQNILLELIRADGFDTGYGDYSVEQWNIMVAGAAKRLGINEKVKVLEVGCGAGAFLYQLYTLKKCEIAGIDYSSSLIECARKYLSNGTFTVSEATKIPYPDASFDVILSHGVFFYFPDIKYANEVLIEIHRKLKPGGKICLMDINDISTKQFYHETRRQNYINKEAYEKKYTGLDHLFFDKEMLRKDLQKFGFTNISFFKHDVPAYINSKFRFNLTAIKKIFE